MVESAKKGPGPRLKASGSSAEAPAATERSWPVSILWAAVIVGVGLLLSAIINPLLGRVVHWDWMAAIAPSSFALFAWALHRRWF